MKESYWGYWLVMLGILVIGVMLLISSTTTGTTQDYYELKETASASVIDAVDYSYYRLYGDLKISKEKFIENFIRRFSESVSMTKKYAIGFYDIHEVPPKVSIKISSVSNSVNIANTANNSFDLVNKIDMILVTGTKEPSIGARTGLCPTISITKNLAYVFQKIYAGETPDNIPVKLMERIRNKKNEFTGLKAWYNRHGNLKDDDYFLEFQVAFRTDFANCFGSLQSDLNAVYIKDPTRASQEDNVSPDERGIIEYAKEVGWIAFDLNMQ